MRRLFSLLVALSLCFPVAPAGAWWKSIQQHGVAAPTGCTQATTFLARTTGFSGTDVTNYTNFICGLQSDGVGCGTVLDALYVLAAPNSSASLLNLCSTSFSLTVNGTTTFSAGHGYTGDGSTGFLDTGYVPSTAGLNYALNSASYGVYVVTSTTTELDMVDMGADVSPAFASASALFPITDFAGGITGYFCINQDVSTCQGPTTTNARGLWVVSQTASNASAVYSGATSISTSTTASTAVPTLSFYVGAEHSDVPADFGFSTHQLAFSFIGGGLNSTQEALIAARIATFAAATGN